MRFFEFFQKVSMTKFVKKKYISMVCLFKNSDWLVDGTVYLTLWGWGRLPKFITCENFGRFIVWKSAISIAACRQLETFDWPSGFSVFFVSSVPSSGESRHSSFHHHNIADRSKKSNRPSIGPAVFLQCPSLLYSSFLVSIVNWFRFAGIYGSLLL